jgi:hypothetical protein
VPVTVSVLGLITAFILTVWMGNLTRTDIVAANRRGMTVIKEITVNAMFNNIIFMQFFIDFNRKFIIKSISANYIILILS